MRFDWKRCLIYNRSFNCRWNYVCCSEVFVLRVLHIFFSFYFILYCFSIIRNKLGKLMRMVHVRECMWHTSKTSRYIFRYIVLFDHSFVRFAFFLVLLFDLHNTLRLNSLGACAVLSAHTETQRQRATCIRSSASVILQSVATLIDSIYCWLLLPLLLLVRFVLVAFSFLLFSDSIPFEHSISSSSALLVTFDIVGWLAGWVDVVADDVQSRRVCIFT